MAETREDYEARVNKESERLAQEYRDAQRESAVQAREEQPDQAETEEEYYERVRLAQTTGIFGDTDTTAGAGASGTDVPSSNNEAATVAVAEVDAAQTGGDDAAEGVTDAQARRQVDVSGTQPSGDTVEESADVEDNSKDEEENAS